MKLAKQAGVTLMELLIVIAIVGLLAGIAFPSYQDSVRKSRRSDAMTAIAEIQMAQQKLRANCVVYAQNIGTGDVCGANAAASTIQARSTSAEGFYALALSAASGTGYTVTATAQGAQADDQVGGTTCNLVLTVSAANPDGVRTPADCW
jgi:type IV pilus assembly protein PilE